ncbi:DNA mismatch repair protein, partial [Backusella circina FSU 941]
NIEKPEQQNFVKFYNSLTDAGQGTLRLFERESNDKACYSLHGNDAVYIATNVSQTTSVIKYWAGDINTGLKTTIISKKVAEVVLREALMSKQMKIEIWKQSRGDWKITHKASPGNLEQVDELLFSNSNLTLAPVIVAVKYGNQKGQKVRENHGKCSMLIQLGAKECIMPVASESDPDAVKISAILDRCNIVASTSSKSDFNDKNIVQDLDRLLKKDLSLTSMAYLSSILLQLLADELNYSQFTLKLYDLSQYMKLDGPAVTALNLMPSIRDGSNKKMSVYGLLNQCKTAQGSRMIGQWIKQPLLDMAEIDLRQGLQEDHLKNVPDLSRLSKRFQKRIGTLQDAVRAYQFCIRLPSMYEFMHQRLPIELRLEELFKTMYMNPIQMAMAKFMNFEQLIESVIDLAATEHHEYMIRAEYSPELQVIRTELDQVQSDINKEFAKVSETHYSWFVDSKAKLEKHSLYGHCIRVPRLEYSKFKNKGRFIEFSTTKSGVLLTTSKLKDLSQSYTDISKSYDKAQKDVIKEVMDVIATYCAAFEDIGNTIAHLDILVSFAHVSVMAPTHYIRPKLTPLGQGNVILKEARHPCLEVQDSVSFIPNDVNLERDVSDFQIITGPNMGGKSTYIRQAGVIALMAQIGCFVPCSEAQLCLFDSILARVGAGDSQLKGVSTFMAEMLETASILQSATKNSLIIIDELGRGTSTYDGFGLAYAISKHIATEIKCFTFFATHFHELTELSKTVPHVKNLSVSFHIGDESEVTLLYKVNEGISDESFGIHVAEIANFPSSVVELAKQKVNELEGIDKIYSSKNMEVDEVLDAEGEALVQKLVEEVSQLMDMDDEMTAKSLDEIREKYKPEIEKYPYLKNIILS